MCLCGRGSEDNCVGRIQMRRRERLCDRIREEYEGEQCNRGEI